MRSTFFLTLALIAAPGPDTGISGEQIERHVRFLGADALAGRKAGTPGADAAARYIAAELARFGLKPLGADESYFQPVPLHASRPEPTNELLVVSPCGATALRAGEDYLVDGGGAASVLPQPVEVVFAGHGIVAPEFDTNDYQDVDVAGKVVAVLTGEPSSDDPGWFAGAQPTVYSTTEAKLRLALSRGARGTLLIPSVHDPEWKDWSYWRRQYAEETIRLAYSVPRHLAVRLGPTAIERLLCGSGLDLVRIHEMETRHAVRSTTLPARVRYRGGFAERDFVSLNVVAGLRGRDPERRDEWVLVSAHYDHLGVGPPEDGDAIYNGVVDNAIGVAGALEIARALAALPPAERPRRSVAFVFTTAEEQGLLGATHYLEHPVVPLWRTVANVNVDGLAHLDAFADVIGIGAELSSLGDALATVAPRHGLQVSEPPAVLAGSEAFAYSDQAAFAEAGIPALLVNEGFEGGRLPKGAALRRFLEWGRTRYHRPSDDLGQPLDFEASRAHAALLRDLVRHVADAEQAPAWRPGSRHGAARARTKAERR